MLLIHLLKVCLLASTIITNSGKVASKRLIVLNQADNKINTNVPEYPKDVIIAFQDALRLIWQFFDIQNYLKRRISNSNIDIEKTNAVATKKEDPTNVRSSRHKNAPCWSATSCSPTDLLRSTIGARGLNFWVRNGTRCASPAMVADQQGVFLFHEGFLTCPEGRTVWR